MRTIDDVRRWLSQDFTGASETAAAPHWRLIRDIRPGAAIVVVRRPLAEIVDSLMALDLRGICAWDRATLTKGTERQARYLDAIEQRVPGVLSVQFADLANEASCARVFEHCLSYPHDPDWWRVWSGINVQAPMRALMRHYEAHRLVLERLNTEAKRHTLAAMRQGRAVPDVDGVTIQEEPFETVWQDGQRLFAEHEAEVGPREGVALDLNLQLVRKLNEIGALHIVTARCNGRLFAYLASVVGPSVESADMLVATQTAFFVSPDFRGLGPRLHRASLEQLKARGVHEVIMRAGTRGSGPKLAALYRRIGAADHGQMFSFKLKAA